MALIYIVEDDESIREIEEFALKNAGHQVIGFENAKDFYKRLEDVTPELVLLDVMLPDESGYEIVKKIRARHETKKLPVIMVTAKTTEIDMIRGLDGGADDYIKKPFSVMELITRVKVLLRRVESDEKSVFKLDLLTLDDSKREAKIDGVKVELTFKEYELLRYLISNKGLVIERNSIMEHVWGFDFEGESRTLDVHIKTLRHKLGDYGNRIRTVRNVGYVIE